MISFAQFLPEEGIPIYLQILRHVKRGIVSGAVADGDMLPSRRELSALLGVNPNTVQKAYRILEEEGLIASHTGARSCVGVDDLRTAQSREELLAADIRAAVAAMKQMGLTPQEASALIAKYWEEI